MNPARRRLLLGAGAVLSSGAVNAAAPDPRAAARALGYLPWWMAAGWRNLAWKELSHLVLFDVAIQPDGRVLDRQWPQRAHELLFNASRAALPVELALSLHEIRHFNAVFSDTDARQRLLAAVARLLELPSIAGIHIDVEGFAPARSDAMAGFREWLQILHQRRRALGKTLSAFYPASDKFAPYDAAAAGCIDYWVAQLYDAHWFGSEVTGPIVTRMESNPVAVQRTLERLEQIRVPRRDILLSIPLYGIEWLADSDEPGARVKAKGRLLTLDATPAELMPNDRRVASELASRHGLRRDAEGTPYYAFRDGSQWMQGWYEDLFSLTRKLAPERTEGYAGLAFFALGYDQGRLTAEMLRWWRSRH